MVPGPSDYSIEDVRAGCVGPAPGDPGAAGGKELIYPLSMQHNTLIGWAALVPQLDELVVATGSPLVRWHMDARFSMPAGFWPRNRWKKDYRLGGVISPDDLPTGWTLWLGLAPTKDGEVCGWVCPCGGEWGPRWLKDGSS